MGYNTQYVFKDKDNFIFKITNDYKNEDIFYIEDSICNLEISLEKNFSVILIFTLFRYFDKENYELKEFEKFLLNHNKTGVIYKINEKLLDDWNGQVNTEYWEEDNNLVDDFFKWIENQDKSLWIIL